MSQFLMVSIRQHNSVNLMSEHILISWDRDCFYTTLCNALDYTSSGFPVTFVDPEVDRPYPPHKFHNHEDEAIFKHCPF
jgi:hypothetical protein